jgi:hypothetical protein
METGHTANEQPQVHDHAVDIVLDDRDVIAPRSHLTGLEIRELGPVERVNGFETQEVNTNGKKIRTIPDNEEIHLHENERFRTVPSEGGPGAST